MGCRYKEMYYKELAHVNMEADKYKICHVSWQARDPGEPMVQLKSESRLLENSL